ncbi:hypothetical protein THTE_1297 [Thermogutta terrifontis]|uniref:Uncharacterized protein n=1 Tax=Thermogutta terrifontis TaxID=1331910 RepID=A0A286RD62_9BACT|nr:hypothetical protein THTE_1297 [Thermogutta terrifontis]
MDVVASWHVCSNPQDCLSGLANFREIYQIKTGRPACYPQAMRTTRQYFRHWSAGIMGELQIHD